MKSSCVLILVLSCFSQIAIGMQELAPLAQPEEVANGHLPQCSETHPDAIIVAVQDHRLGVASVACVAGAATLAAVGLVLGGILISNGISIGDGAEGVWYKSLIVAGSIIVAVSVTVIAGTIIYTIYRCR